MAKSIVSEILRENGLKISGWETVVAGGGISWHHPVIVNRETNERGVDMDACSTPMVTNEFRQIVPVK